MILGLGRFPGEGIGYPLQYSGLENSMDYVVHGVTKSRTQLSLSQAEKGPKCRKVISGLYLRVFHIQVQVKPSEKLYSPR